MTLESDIRITPPDLWAIVREFAAGRPICDVCTEPSNPLGAEVFFTEQDNSMLMRDWADHPFLNYCNSPYSRGQLLRARAAMAGVKTGWAPKVVEQARRGREVLMLTRCDTRTRWFRYLRDNADARCMLEGSYGFLMPDGNKLPGDTIGHVFWYFGPRRRRFDAVFSPHGEVSHLLGPQEMAS